MNRRKIIFILSLILLIAVLFGISVSNNQIKISKNNIDQSFNFKNDNEVENNEGNSLQPPCDIVADIQEKLEDSYSVQLNVSSNRCVKKIYDATDVANRTLMYDWSNNMGNTTSGIVELQKNKEYNFEVELASGKIIKKDFELKTAAIKLNAPVKNSDGTFSFPNATLINPCGDDFNYVVLQFASGIKSGDRLVCDNISGVTVNSSNTMVSISVEGKTTEEIENIIRNNFKVSLAEREQNEEVSIKVSINNNAVEISLNYYSNTEHFYEFISAPGITWENAKIAAESKTYMGMKGYLATITSEGEDDFAMSLISGYGWLGGTCDYRYILDKDGNQIYNNMSESLWNWYWVTGPEAGMKFWDNTGTITEYSKWGSGEPNNYGSGEAFLHYYQSNTWNDYPNNESSIAGYIVEYGGMPGDEYTMEESYSDVSVINTNWVEPTPTPTEILEDWQISDKASEGLFTEANQLLGTAHGRSYYKSNDIPAIATAYYLQGAEFMLISPIEDGTIGWCSYDPSHPSSDYDSDEIMYNGIKYYYRAVNYIFLGGEPLGDVYCINVGNVSSRQEAVEKTLQYYYGE